MKATINGITYEGTAEELQLLDKGIVRVTQRQKRTKWSAKENLELISLSHQGKTIKEIAQYLGRTELGVRSRLQYIRDKQKQKQNSLIPTVLTPNETKQTATAQLNETVNRLNEATQKLEEVTKERDFLKKSVNDFITKELKRKATRDKRQQIGTYVGRVALQLRQCVKRGNNTTSKR